MRQSRNVHAISGVRAISVPGLRDAKDGVERLTLDINKEET